MSISLKMCRRIRKKLSMRIFIDIFNKIFRVIFLIIRSLCSFHEEKIVIKERSKYNQMIIISECGSKRIMRFQTLLSGAQSQIDLNRKDTPDLEYIQLMLLSLIYFPQQFSINQILIIGLGGGILPRALRKILPFSSITILEIDSIVYQMAKKYFFFQEDLNMKVILTDGRLFLNELSNSISYDLIFFDAYNCENDVPSQMKTKEFFYLLQNHLNINGGLIILNLVCIYQSYLNIRQTIHSIFQENNNYISFRSNDFLNIILILSHQNKHFPTINQKMIEMIEKSFSIDVYSLLRKKQEQIPKQYSTAQIYTDQQFEHLSDHQNISFTEFLRIV